MIFRSNRQSGFAIVEVLLASSIFALLVVALVGAYLYGEQATALAGNRTRAVFLAEEGLEAARNISDADFANLVDGNYGLAIVSNHWSFSGSQDTVGIFTRQIVISTVDTNRKNITANVTWQQNPQRTGSVSLVTYLTNWQASSSVAASCNDYAIEQAYSAGTCRQNAVQCGNNGEIHLTAGDVYCTGGASADTCCALP
ncbi:MAG: hypothetical protein JW816_00220 [Candidatus Buchananbacteria bacterium]|nr:hypothetical protein [Candidatus Buchananbacteria bacterium]